MRNLHDALSEIEGRLDDLERALDRGDAPTFLPVFDATPPAGAVDDGLKLRCQAVLERLERCADRLRLGQQDVLEELSELTVRRRAGVEYGGHR